MSTKELEELLSYEIRMFKDTYKELAFFENFDQFKRNLLIESLALHTRVLFDFFYCKQKHKDDIIAQDLLQSHTAWAKIRPQPPKILKEAKQKADKQLAHLSLARIKLKKDNKHGWNFYAINKEMDKTINLFYDTKEKAHLVT